MNSNVVSSSLENQERHRDDVKKPHTKRRRNVSEWNREKRKRLRVAGQEYVNSKGEVVGQRKIGVDCKCRRKCFVKVNETDRKKLFDSYYSLNSHDEQNAYLFGLIRKHEIARRRSRNSEKRTCTFKYFVQIKDGSKEVQVCRVALCHIHAISAHKVRLLCEKLDRNIICPRDERGRHNNRPSRIPDELIFMIQQHIVGILKSDRLKDFIKDEKQIKNQMGCDVNITKMWRDFLNEHIRNACFFDSPQIAQTLESQPDQDSSDNDSSSNTNNDDNEDSSNIMRIDQKWTGPSVKLWLYNKIFHTVVTEELMIVLQDKIAGIKSERTTESQCCVGNQSSTSLAEKLEPVAQTASSNSLEQHTVDQSMYLSAPPTQLVNQSQKQINSSTVFGASQNNFSFPFNLTERMGVQSTVEALTNAQFYRTDLLGQHFLA